MKFSMCEVFSLSTAKLCATVSNRYTKCIVSVQFKKFALYLAKLFFAFITLYIRSSAQQPVYGPFLHPLTQTYTAFALYIPNEQIMKKHLLWFPVAATVVLLAAWSKPIIANISFQKPVSKSISFAVYSANNYASRIYDDASAKLAVAIIKVSGGKRSIVWQKSYDAKLLNQYPCLANAISQKVVINNVDEGRDRLEVVYTLTYSSNGGTTQLQDGTIISKGEKEGKLFINI
jgi:hypothetical protein